MAANPTRALRTTNPRNVIIEYTRSIIDRVVARPDRVAISDIMDQVRTKFLSDRDFMLSLAIMNVEEITRAAIGEAIAETRGPSRRVIVRDFVTTPADMVAQTPALMAQLALRWGRFLEWNGQVHVRLTAMTKVDLLAAAEIREERAAREAAYADFFRRLAAKLPDNDAAVADHIPLEQIEEIWVAVQRKHGRIPPPPPVDPQSP